MDKKEEIACLLSIRLRRLFMGVSLPLEELQEIRLRIGKPVIFICGLQEFFLTEDGNISTENKKSYCLSKNELKETMEYICNYSFYAYEEEMKQGFITVQGGHRIGIVGKVIVENGGIKNIRYISCINIRLAHEVKGCAENILPWLFLKEEKRWLSTLIISPPRCGKTTLLRDMIRCVSNGIKLTQKNRLRNGKVWECKIAGATVGVVDERSELGACYLGNPQNDLGIRTDILDGCPKAEGIMMLIRSMSPTVLAVDEIGGESDKRALEQAINSGCTIFATAHGDSLEMIKEKGLDVFFQRFVILKTEEKVGECQGIFDKKGNNVITGEFDGKEGNYDT